MVTGITGTSSVTAGLSLNTGGRTETTSDGLTWHELQPGIWEAQDPNDSSKTYRRVQTGTCQVKDPANIVLQDANGDSYWKMETKALYDYSVHASYIKETPGAIQQQPSFASIHPPGYGSNEGKTVATTTPVSGGSTTYPGGGSTSGGSAGLPDLNGILTGAFGGGSGGGGGYTPPAGGGAPVGGSFDLTSIMNSLFPPISGGTIGASQGTQSFFYGSSAYGSTSTPTSGGAPYDPFAYSGSAPAGGWNPFNVLESLGWA